MFTQFCSIRQNAEWRPRSALYDLSALSAFIHQKVSGFVYLMNSLTYNHQILTHTELLGSYTGYDVTVGIYRSSENSRKGSFESNFLSVFPDPTNWWLLLKTM